jgi:hypothetical protein
MLHDQAIPASKDSVYISEQATPDVPGQGLPTTTPRHVACQLRSIAREIVGRRAYHARRRRLLYRQNLSDSDLDALVVEIGADRLVHALDRYTRPELPLQVVS